MRLPPRTSVAAVAASTLAALALASTASAAATTRTTVKGSVPPWAKSASFKGAAADTARVGFRIYLGWHDASTAESLARAVSTPGTSGYHHFLTPAQFRNR